MNDQKPIHCRLVDSSVTLFWHTLPVSGIGSAGVVLQRDYGCSREETCEHRPTAGCPVRRLNG